MMQGKHNEGVDLQRKDLIAWESKGINKEMKW